MSVCADTGLTNLYQQYLMILTDRLRTCGRSEYDAQSATPFIVLDKLVRQHEIPAPAARGGVTMSEVVDFVQFQSRRSRGLHPPFALDALNSIVARITRVCRIQLITRNDMQEAIFVLKLSNAHARQLIGRIADPETRARLTAHSERIEQLVEIAGRKAAAL